MGGQSEEAAGQTELSQVLQQQIAQAIEPVLAEFRAQVTRAVQDETQLELPKEVNGIGTPQAVQQLLSGTQQGQHPDTEEPGGQATETAETSRPEEPRSEAPQTQAAGEADRSQPEASAEAERQSPEGAPEQQPSEPAGEQEAAPGGQKRAGVRGKLGGVLGPALRFAGRPDSKHEASPDAHEEEASEEGPKKPGVRGKVGGALNPALRLAEHQTEQWIQSLLMAGVSALLAESMHNAAQRQAEHGLHLLLEKAFGALPGSASNRDLQVQAERTLQAILRESLNAVFAEQTRTTVQQHGEEAVRESLHGHFGAALQKVQDAVRAMVQALVDVLRRQWHRVLRLLLKIVLMALEASLASADEEKESSSAGGSDKSSDTSTG